MTEAAGFRPRAGQREILEYEGGRMGVAAVPGSGKTATIAALTSRLLEQRVDGKGGMQPSRTQKELHILLRDAARAGLVRFPTRTLRIRCLGPSCW